MFLKLLKKRFGVTDYRECPSCEGKGRVWIQKNPSGFPDPLDVVRTCPTCGGTGRLPVHTIKERRR